MRLLCRDDHDTDDDICPPHQFEGGWSSTGSDGAQEGVIFCVYCADIRPLVVPTVDAPVEESVSVEREP